MEVMVYLTEPSVKVSPIPGGNKKNSGKDIWRVKTEENKQK
jgi:hypothetical protein